MARVGRGGRGGGGGAGREIRLSYEKIWDASCLTKGCKSSVLGCLGRKTIILSCQSIFKCTREEISIFNGIF